MGDQENITLIRNMYAAFGTGDVQRILGNVSDNAEWDSPGPETVPYAGSWNGKTRIAEFFRTIGQSTSGAQVIPENFVASGDTVVATGRFRATVQNTGAQIDTPIAHVFTIRNGKVVKWVGYADTARLAQAHSVRSAAGR